MCKHYLKLILFFAAISPMLNACLEDYTDFNKYKDVTLKQHIALPLGFADFSISDLLEKLDTIVDYHNDSVGTVVLSYEDSLAPRHLLDLISPGGFSYADEMDLNIAGSIYVPAGDTLETNSMAYTINYENNPEYRIDSLFLKSGKISFNLISGLPGDILIKISFASIYKNGVPFSDELLFRENPPFGISESQEIDLTGTKIDFSGGGVSPDLSFTIKAYYISNGGTVNPAQQIGFELQTNALSLNAIYGYLGNHLINFPEEIISMDIFKIFDQGLVNFSFPYMRIYIATNGGIPMGVKIASFYIESTGNELIPLTGRVLDSIVYVIPEGYSGQQDIKTNVLEVNADNSSFREIFHKFPKEINFNILAELNPPEYNNDKNFLTDESDIRANYNMTIPLALTLFNLHGSDSADLDLGDIDSDVVKEAAVKVKYTNGFPLGGKIHIRLSATDPVSSLDLIEGDNGNIQPAITDDNGIIVQASIDSVIINLTDKQIQDLLSSDKIVYDVTLNTDRSDEDILVRITEESFIKLDVGVAATIEPSGASQ